MIDTTCRLKGCMQAAGKRAKASRISPTSPNELETCNLEAVTHQAGSDTGGQKQRALYTVDRVEA